MEKIFKDFCNSRTAAQNAEWDNIKPLFCMYSGMTKRSAYKMAVGVYEDAKIYFCKEPPKGSIRKKEIYIVTDDTGMSCIWSENY
jgi:hypothetical protein